MRIIAPVTRATLFNETDREFLTELGTNDLWVLEYGLTLWFAFGDGREDLLYEQIIDDYYSTFILHNYTPEDDARQLLLAHRADDLVELVKRVYQSYRPFLKSIPDAFDQLRDEDHLTGVALTLQNENQYAGYSVVGFHYYGDGRMIPPMTYL